MADRRAQIQGWIRNGLTATREPVSTSKGGDTSTHSSRIFAYVIDHMETDVSMMKAATFAELKERSTKAKGDLWETFCQMYLEAHGYTVYRLKDTPREIAEYLKLVKEGKNIVDVGIDLVAITPTRQPVAVQCKYRYCNGIKNKWRPSGKTGITWAALSTFYALCSHTGPWAQRLVMTNCDFVKRQGEMEKLDASMTKKNFNATEMAIWNAIAPPLSKSHSLVASTAAVVSMVASAAGAAAASTPTASLTREAVRDKRAALLAKLAKPG